ncbi:NFACT family protein [Bacillus sp. AGMB 02131]|uniref:Rqc2 homolog RqcH n=1 Tax=Peribacillus faecalis TaxID=2772559 RepID=A0A927CRY2_9BACI|nr:NFACT RNA binding domain-containing protein [Peribacillus faecalis]MBD3106788.1 NFACT family protein [Peribacillus faecalis]
MSFDGLFTKAMCEELTSALSGGRINKIHQPYPNEIILIVRANGKNQKLLLSAHPSYSRAQLTEESYENPQEPPMFCMLLRKHLEGAIIENITQHELDRMIIFDIKGRDELGDLSYKKLIVEIMGRHSNIVLVNKENNLILDSIKHVSYAVNSHRAILPGQTYKFPPAQQKINPLTASDEDVLKALDFNAGTLDKQLVSAFAGISPLLAKEMLFESKLPTQANVLAAFNKLMMPFKNNQYNPAIMLKQNKEIFYCIPLASADETVKTFSSLSEMLDRFYFGKAARDRIKQQGQDLERFITNERAKNEKKIKKLKATLTESEKGDQFKLYGELLTANIYQLQIGMKEIEVINYYDENGTMITIPLDPQKTPSQNAQKYFTKYQKAKNAVEFVTEQIQLASEEVAYFEGLLQQLDSADPRDIEEMREELQEGGYLKQRNKKGFKKSKDKKPVLDEYVSSDGDTIYVGKNNKQNEYLTNKFSRRDDIWLHTKDIPGSHVVIRNSEPSEQTLHEAAVLAAFYSKAKNSSRVPVDYTMIRHVKKPSGSKPGFVIYDNQTTLYVTPDADEVLRMKK